MSKAAVMIGSHKPAENNIGMCVMCDRSVYIGVEAMKQSNIELKDVQGIPHTKWLGVECVFALFDMMMVMMHIPDDKQKDVRDAMLAKAREANVSN